MIGLIKLFLLKFFILSNKNRKIDKNKDYKF